MPLAGGLTFYEASPGMLPVRIRQADPREVVQSAAPQHFAENSWTGLLYGEG
jgi:hypothetical protein